MSEASSSGDTLAGLVVDFAADFSSITDAVAQMATLFASLSGMADEAGVGMSEGLSQVGGELASLTTVADEAGAGIAEGLAQGAVGAQDIAATASEVDAALGEIAGAAEEAGAGVAEGMASASEELANVAGQAQETAASVSQVGSSANDASSGGIGGFVSGLGDMVTKAGLAVIGVQGLATGAQNLAGALLGPAATAETTQLSFATLMHSTAAAKQEMVDLNTYAAGTPMQTQWVDTAAAKMLAFGISNKSIIPDITAIGDSLSGLGNLSDASLNSIVDIFGKINVEGKLTGGTMMELSRWGIPAWQSLAQATGLPIPELQKMVSKGLIPAQQGIADLRQGMENTFGGGMKAQANTFVGLLSTFQSNAQIAMAALGGPLLKIAEQGIGNLGNILSSPSFQKFAVVVGTDIGNAISEFSQDTQKAGQFLSSTFLPPIEHLGQALQPIITPIVQWAVQNDVLQKSLQGVVAITGGLLTGLATLINDAASILMYFEKNQVAADVLVGVLAGLTFIVIAMNAAAIIAAVTSIPGLVIGFGAWAIGALAAAAATMAAAWPILLIGALIAAVVVGIILAVQHWAAITQWFGSVWNTVWTGVSTFFTGLWDGIVSGVEQALGGIGRMFQSLGPSLYNFFIQPFVDGWHTISNIFGGIGQLISDMAHFNFGAIPGDLHAIGIPGFAGGVQNFSGGWAVVGENGPELVQLPGGSSVYPHGSSPYGSPLQGSGSGSNSGQPQHIVIMLDGQVLGEALGNTQQRQIYLRTGIKVA